MNSNKLVNIEVYSSSGKFLEYLYFKVDTPLEVVENFIYDRYEIGSYYRVVGIK